MHTEEGDGMDSSNNSENNDTTIPDAVNEWDWTDLGVVRVCKCEHGRYAILKKAWGGKHTGHRFSGCPIQEEMDQCQFVEWLDEPWPDHIEESLKEVWKQLKQAKHVESRAAEAL
ncbi:uncharacterized protein [Miscanthus floridulus]|uniref:uncharacterized protein n=1 Tax=Miscanthus floridulus TaxID=154761 RepID=UPI003458C72C